MKKLTIGRNNACDIIIPDTSDLVSRKQAVLTYSFWGKMVLYDTSNNGTYLNGQRIENGKGVKVTRKDKVNFARVTDLDWSEVMDPYRKTKLYALVSTVIAAVVSVLVALWLLQSSNSEKDIYVSDQNEVYSEKGGTVTTVKPVIVEDQPQPQPKKKVRKKSKSKKEVTPKDLVDKKVNDNIPIVY